MKIPTLDKLYTFKDVVFDKLKLNRFFRILISIGLTPNKVSFFNIFVGLMAVLFLFNNHTLFVLFYVLNRLLDILDGYLARIFDMKTELGDKLDHWGDLFVHIGLLAKTIFFSSYTLLACVTLFTFISEYILLKKDNLLNKKFPSGVFAFIFIFGFYKFGLIYQIFYQTVSYIFLRLYLRKQK